MPDMINPQKGIDQMNNNSIINRILFVVTIFQHKEAKQHAIAIVEASPMIKTSMVSSPSNLSQEHFGDFDNHTRGIGSKLIKQMSCNGQELGKRSQGIINPIVAELKVKHEDLGFNGTEERHRTPRSHL
jgi:hypothetical protein